MGSLLRLHWPLALPGGVLALGLLWGMLAPLRGGSHELPLELGTAHAPHTLRLTLGVQDVLLLRNAGRVPLVCGPVQLAPGADMRLPVEAPGEQRMSCPALPGGSLLLRVVPMPDPGWDRLRWRLDSLSEAIRTLPVRRPE
ncbi:hypothetical protein LE190_00255 [Massilia oculi]|uniref:Uncharacterized protein n=1 Tax=Massilia hydrophila TaxID=3044279 RepID=A0ABS7Y7H4_9BURK|nr:hypothetical protein [Massilia oculi]MCA1854360.1 hypothetical protein [Massilia oculi]